MSRDQIIVAAIQHLNHDPAASMADIAEATGVSRATLHRHFAGREELLLALGHRALDRWEEAQDRAGIEQAAHSTEPAVIIAALREMLSGLIGEAEEYNFALTDLVMSVVPELRERGDELEGREIALYQAAQRAGALRADLPVRWISNTVYGLLLAVRESLNRGDVARRDLPRVLHETFFRGVGEHDPHHGRGERPPGGASPSSAGERGPQGGRRA
ncbi:TetR/AcrR family transcriptional regulator [Streptosporangium sp. NBC_01755]|uniref:TetR/AcrR family transcriptional regulator n=1 Tax=unclassified Streptosporangium TaxID=2632669 RepID=UPI002DD9F9BF|nr:MULTISPECIES: TetR/AcrR family transcriptional regulator [unclassified Streptosporangium]WSA28510.1 TetR/AcrR family transcriptional regulator [Streptosporangium sp. NBC_01810]WSD00003.1 TetR/AcrR family transcriptional regulator [Streptosporangium sp. NBC_01755]